MVIPKAKSQASNWLALKKSKDAVFQEKASKYHRKLQEDKKKNQVFDERGVIFVSNIPHGFFESEMFRYFRQFGVVKRLRLARSKRTGESCGYGYVEFEHKEIAKIVAKHMDGYLTFGKIMKCQFVPQERMSWKLFESRDIRPHNCPKILSRKKAINKLNEVRSESKDKKRIKRLRVTYEKKLKMLEGFGISLNLELPVLVKASVSSKPKEMKTTDGTGEKSSSEDIAQDVSPDCDTDHSSQNPGKMVIEVDQSDVEIQFKTPPNAVKKYVKIAPSVLAAENSVSGKPILAAAKKMSRKKKGTTTELSENMVLDEEKNAPSEVVVPDENPALEDKVSSNPLVTRDEKVPISKKKKLAMKSISKCKENISETPKAVVLPNEVECIQGNAPLPTASDISLSKPTPVKRKQANKQTPAKKLLKKFKVTPSPTTSDAQVVPLDKVSSAKGTPESRKTISNGIDTSSIVEVTTNISQLSPALETLVQTSEQTQFPLTSKKAKTPKKKKVVKKTVSPLPTDTKTPKKVKKINKVVTSETSQSNSQAPKIADLENVTVFPESKVKSSSGASTANDEKVIDNTLKILPAVENPIETSEQEQTPPTSKKTKTPKNKTKKTRNVNMPLDEEKNGSTGVVVPDESPALEKKLLSNLSVTRDEKVPLSKKKKLAMKSISKCKEHFSETPEAVVLPKKVECIQGNAPLSTESDISLSKTTPVKRKQVNKQTPAKKLFKKIKVTPSPTTSDAQVVPLDKVSSAKGTPESRKTISNGIDTSSSVEVTTNISQLSPALETLVQTSEQTQFPLTSKKAKTPKKKKVVKKTVSPLPTDTKTPKKLIK